MLKTESINIIHTSCKKCVFAEYNENTQIACCLNLLDKFKNKGVEVLNVYDEEKEYFVINNKKCVGYKEEKYFQNRGLSSSSLDKKIQYVKNNLKVNYAIVINIKKYKNNNLEKLAESISQLKIKPSIVYVIRYRKDRGKYSYDQIQNFLNQCQISKWKIKTILDPKIKYDNVLHSTINEDKKNKFLLSINGNYSNLDKIVLTAQKKIYEELTTFLVLSNAKKESILFNTDVYRYGIFNGQDILNNTDKYEIV